MPHTTRSPPWPLTAPSGPPVTVRRAEDLGLPHAQGRWDRQNRILTLSPGAVDPVFTHETVHMLRDLGIMEGDLPSRATRLVRLWARLHAEELRANWSKAREGLPLDTIPGLE